jgi:hypothetical protein
MSAAGRHRPARIWPLDRAFSMEEEAHHVLLREDAPF